MKVDPIKTKKVSIEDDLFSLLDSSITAISERSVLAVTSKIVAITEKRVVPVEEGNTEQKLKLIEEESSYYLLPSSHKYNVSLTITNNSLAPSAGIDESNANGNYVLWPKDPQASANSIRKYLRERYRLKEFGVIITDSTTRPLRWGVTAMTIGYSGIVPLKDYVGTPDLYGRPFQFEKTNIIDGLATSSALVMGEGAEQTPMALMTDLPFVTFVDADPTDEEVQSLFIEKEDDLYGPLLTTVSWKKGKKS